MDAATPRNRKLAAAATVCYVSLGDAVHRPPVSSSYSSRVAPEELFITLAHGKSPLASFTFNKGTLWVAPNKHQNFGLQADIASSQYLSTNLPVKAAELTTFV